MLRYALDFVTYVFKISSRLDTIQYLSDVKHSEDKKSS